MSFHHLMYRNFVNQTLTTDYFDIPSDIGPMVRTQDINTNPRNNVAVGEME